MYNNKLKAEMLLKGKTADDVCKAAGFSKSAWFRKIAGVTEFTQGEMQAIADLLNLDQQKICEVFFAEQVS